MKKIRLFILVSIFIGIINSRVAVSQAEVGSSSKGSQAPVIKPPASAPPAVTIPPPVRAPVEKALFDNPAPTPQPDQDLQNIDMPPVFEPNTDFGVQEGPSSVMPSMPGSPSQAPAPLNPRGPTQEINDNIMIDVLELKAMDIIDVLKLLSQKSGLNIVAGNGVQGKVTIYLKDVPLKDVLYIILDANDLAYQVEEKVIRVMPAREFEQRYGYKFGGKIQTRILRVSHIEVPDAVAVLNQMKSSSGKIISDQKSGTIVLMDTADKLKDMEELLKEIDVPIAVEVFELSYAKAKDVAPKIQEMLTKNVGSMRFDEVSNKIVVKDSPLKIKEIRETIAAFDVRRREVLIEAKIVQIILNDEHKLGVDWQAILRDYHQLTLTGNLDIFEASAKKGTASIGTIDTDDYTALVEALETVGNTNILSSPRITALNNEEAKILVGSTEPYVTSTTTTPASGPTTTAESVNFIDVGVKLYVTPTIHKDDFITMKIKPEVSSVTKTVTTSQNNTIPVVETSEAETMVMVKDGVTVVIGGLIKEESIDAVNKIPLLGDIPLLGFAFRNSSSKVAKTEIVIFLTPRIVSGDIDAEDDEHPMASADLSY